MPFGPFLRRELLTSSRRRSTYGDRAVAAGLVLAIVAAVFAIWDANGWDRASVSGMNGFTTRVFAFVVGLQVVVVMGGVTNDVAGGLAGERERKTLDALLSTRLGDAEIVLGMTASALFRCASGQAAVFPILMAMVPFGGIDPRLVLLASGGLASFAFALAALSAVAALGARDRREATNGAMVLVLTWVGLPFLVVIFVPRFWPGGAGWLVPVALPVLDSSPLGLLASLGGLGRVGLSEAFARMVGLQMAGGALLLLWAVVRLRPACRAVYDEEGRALWFLQTRRVRRGRWPACGDDPVLWREIHTTRGPRAGLVGRLIGGLVHLALLAALGVATYWFAEPAFRELLARGYGAGAEGARAPEITPFAMALVRGSSQGPPPGEARVEFNAVLKESTPVWVLFYVLALAASAAEGVAVERARDTLPGLIATPLTGREILRAKMLAAAWRTRKILTIPIGLWAVGLLAGALHPLGVLSAAVALGVATWFLVALGAYQSLRAKDPGQATVRTILPVMLLTFGPLVVLLVPWAAPLQATSTVFHAWLSLASYEDVRDLLRSGVFPPLARLGVRTAGGTRAVLAASLVALIAQGIAAVLLTRAAYRGFDSAVDRPIRARRSRDGRSPLPASDQLN